MARMHEKTAPPRDLTRWRNLFLCFLAQNCGIGVTYGVFGPLLASTEQQLGVSRSAATMAVAVIGLTVGVVAPLLGQLLGRISVRTAMVSGAAISAAAYWGVAATDSLVVMLALYAVIAAGIALMVVLGPVILVSRWFVTGRGKALSVVNLPIAMLVVPYVAGALLPSLGRAAILQGVGGIFLLLALVLLFVKDQPVEPVQAPGADVQAQPDGSLTLSSRDILRPPAFWLLSAAIGIMAGAGTGFIVHIVPYGVEIDLTLADAAGLVSAFALAGVGGTLLFGWIADRIGPTAALALAAAAQAATWWALLHTSGWSLYAAAAVMGICVAPMTTLHGAALSWLFGAANVSRAMGYSYVVKLPFNFGFAPVLAMLYDHFEGYRIPFLAAAGLTLCAGLIVAVSLATASGRTRAALAGA